MSKQPTPAGYRLAGVILQGNAMAKSKSKNPTQARLNALAKVAWYTQALTNPNAKNKELYAKRLDYWQRRALIVQWQAYKQIAKGL